MKTRSELGQSSKPLSPRFAKTHEGYWKARLRRRTYRTTDGEAREVPEWQVKLFSNGQQRWVNLGTANRDVAAKKARDCWLKLKTSNWEAVKPQRERIANPTVGDFLAAVRTESNLQPGTFAIYAKKFRRLVAGVFGIRADAQKHDHANGGYDRWLERIHAVRFSRLNARSVQRWKTKYITAAGTNPLRERRARRTIASILRSSKALFAPGVLAKLHIDLPKQLPLADVDIPRVGVAQYISRITPEILFQEAQRELATPTPEMLKEAAEASLAAYAEARKARQARKKREGKKPRAWTPSPAVSARWLEVGIERERRERSQMFQIFCLALFAGLRRDEIDTLTWKQIDFAQQLIRIETNEFTRAKSEGSEAGVDVDPTFLELLRQWMQESASPFVIDTGVAPRPNVSTYHHYRCDKPFKKLLDWLHHHGVEDRNALHTLRKEFGTQINRAYGLFAASASLRHSSIQLTRAVYVAKKDRAVFSMPALNVISVSGSENLQKANAV